jgi:hypothetical protein
MQSFPIFAVEYRFEVTAPKTSVLNKREDYTDIGALDDDIDKASEVAKCKVQKN